MKSYFLFYIIAKEIRFVLFYLNNFLTGQLVKKQCLSKRTIEKLKHWFVP